MKTSLNRRDWLKTALIRSAGLTMSGGLSLINCNSRRKQIPGTAKDNIILLDQNENPYGISPHAETAINDAIKYANRYPDDHSEELVELIAETEGFEKENIVLGAGATEIFRTAGLLYCTDGKEVVLADPSYFGFVNYTEKVNGRMVKVPLDGDFRHDLEAISGKVSRNTSMIYICNPNNPTGTIAKGADLSNFCIELSKQAPVFIDEAYHDFVEDPDYSSMTGLVKEGHDVIIARTFSKIHGFAGLRVGYAIAKKEIIDEFKRIRTNFASIGVLSLRAAIASYKDNVYTDSCRQKNREAKEYFYGILKGIGFDYIPSQTNFVLFPIDRDSEKFRDEILEKGIKVRPVSFQGNHYCRVSIGTMDDMKKTAETLKALN